VTSANNATSKAQYGASRSTKTRQCKHRRSGCYPSSVAATIDAYFKSAAAKSLRAKANAAEKNANAKYYTVLSMEADAEAAEAVGTKTKLEKASTLPTAFKPLRLDVDAIDEYVIAHAKVAALFSIAAKLIASKKTATATADPSTTAPFTQVQAFITTKSAVPTTQPQAKAAATATTSKNAVSTKPKKKADQNPSTLIQEEHEQKIPTPLATIENWWLCKDGSIKGIIYVSQIHGTG